MVKESVLNDQKLFLDTKINLNIEMGNNLNKFFL